jgi:hypothetical protein
MPVDGIGWSDDLVVVEAEMPLAEALARIRAAAARWVVVRRHGGQLLYAFRTEELLLSPRVATSAGEAATRISLATAFDLHETQLSTTTPDRTQAAPIDRSWRSGETAPSVDRWIEVGPGNVPRAVGALPFTGSRGITRAIPPPSRGPAQPQRPVAAPASAPVTRGGGVAPAPTEDEGTTPVRHPSIEVSDGLVPGARVAIEIDLLRTAVAHTQGEVVLGAQSADWTTIALTVHLQCPALAFEAGASSDTVTIRRNAPSVPATLWGRVRDDAPAAPTAIVATFFDGTRYCGTAVRVVAIGAVAAVPSLPPLPPPQGAVVVERGATAPDLTVHISALDAARPGRLRWLVVTERFDGLPARLEADIDLGVDPAAQASTLFKEFAMLERGAHARRIEGFGSRLWALAPEMFRQVYWAVSDRLARAFTIQFVSDEPHLPWELMRPVRVDESEVHPPLALRHAVARWIKRWDGYMRNHLPPGGVVTIAPAYPSAARRLQRAQAESMKLERDFGARRTAGTREAVLDLLEAPAPPEPVALLHFAGHGTFAPEAASASAISLEDGDLAAAEIERPEVRLGRNCRTLVFFNACEVGAVGAVFGEVGGWADAFLGRQFGGFIAPLWAVDDDDAGVVASELLDSVLTHARPIGVALRDLRAAHGAESPTFYSYLYYGDVTARIAP